MTNLIDSVSDVPLGCESDNYEILTFSEAETEIKRYRELMQKVSIQQSQYAKQIQVLSHALEYLKEKQ